MKNKIIILHDFDFVKTNFKEIEKLIRDDSYAVMPLSDSIYLFLKKNGITSIDYHEIEYKGMYSDVYATAMDWSANWYKPQNDDITLAGSFSLGSIIEWSMVHFFLGFLKMRLLLAELIKKNELAEIRVIGYKDFKGTFFPRGRLISAREDILIKVSDLLPLILNQCIMESGKAIKIDTINLPYSHYEVNLRSSLRETIKRIIIRINVALYFICDASNIFLKRKKVLFFEGFHHFYSIMTSSVLAKFNKIHLQKIIGPSIFFKLYNNGIKVASLYQNSAKEFKPYCHFDLERLRNRLSGLFVYRNVDLFPCLWPRFNFLFQFFFPDIMCKDLQACIRAIDRIYPDCVVTENDATYFEKMLVVTAKNKKIPTVVIQHGMTWLDFDYQGRTCLIHDFCYLNSDFIFTYGKASKDWIVNRGIDEKRVVVTGAARFDAYYKPRTGGSNRGRRVLILLNDFWSMDPIVDVDISLNTFYSHIEKFIALAKNNPDIDFIVRPHHNDNIWNELFKDKCRCLGNFRISREEPLEELLGDINLAVGYTSTALIEALICRVPVITLGFGDYFNPLPLWRYGLSKKVSSFEELDTAIKEILYNQEERAAYIDNIRKEVSFFNYNDDGASAYRIAEGLKKVALNKNE